MAKRRKTSKKVQPVHLSKIEMDVRWHFYWGFRKDKVFADELEGMSPSLLKDDGFTDLYTQEEVIEALRGQQTRKSKSSVFVKSFSDVLELRISGPYGESWSCEWLIDDKKFKDMNNDLRLLKRRIDTEASSIYRLSGVKKRSSGWEERFEESIAKAVPKVRHAVEDYLKKYRDFLAVSRRFPYTEPYPREEIFFFDACRSRHELDLFFDFIKLYFEVFVGLRRAKLHMAVLAPGKVNMAVLLYHAMRKTVTNIRRLDRQGWDLDDLKRKFSMVHTDMVEAIAGYIDGIPEGRSTPSKIAYDYVAGIFGTSAKYLKTRFDEERAVFLEARNLVNAIHEPERILAFEDSFALYHLYHTSSEEIRKDDWMEYIRWTLVQRSLCDSRR